MFGSFALTDALRLKLVELHLSYKVYDNNLPDMCQVKCHSNFYLSVN